MPGPIRLLTRRAGTIGLALSVYDVWRRLPPRQRQLLLEATRKHGPRIALAAARRGHAAAAAAAARRRTAKP